MKTMLKTLLPSLLLILFTACVTQAAPLLKLDLSLDRDILPAGRQETAIIKVALNVPEIPYETERPPVNLTLVLDRSGSMAGDKIAKAREAALTALRMLGPQDLFSLVIYDHNVQTLISPQSAANSEWIAAQIRRIGAGGNTALFGAVSQGAAEVRKNLKRSFVHRVILLSDGLANVGPSSPSDLARLGAALLKEGISVTTVGIGHGFNEDLMTQLADRSDGNHYFVESSIDLPRIFAAELGDVLSVAARRINIELETPAGVRPLRIIGREGRIFGNRVETHLNQLYGGQEKYILLEVQVNPGQPDQLQKIADARISYENALTNLQESTVALAQIRFSPNPEEVLQSANKPVLKAVVENEIAASRERALDLYNAGRKDDAVDEIRKSSDKLKAQSATLGFSDLAEEAEAFEGDAATFSAPTLPSAVKKEIRSESYKVRKQQKDY
jgi:Ca-activated chloride channel family protein